MFLLYVIHFFLLLTKMVSGYLCNFEDYYCPWTTTGKNIFVIIKATEGRHKGLPMVDVTEGTPEGHYALLMGRNPIDYNGSLLISPCFGSSLPGCHLRFKTVIFGNLRSEHITIYLKNCSSDDSLTMLDGVRNRQDPKWQTITIDIPPLADSYSIVLAAYASDLDSFIALDDLEMVNCQPISANKSGCGVDEFRCHSSLCISKDRVCNLYHDCLDGEDEAIPECDNVPSYARVSFENCDFIRGDCGWHNAPANVSWKLGRGMATTLTGPAHDHTTELYDQSGHYVYMESANQNIGNIAKLESTVFRISTNNSSKCKVRFFYHMFGQHVYRLKLEVIEICKEENISTNIIWSRTGRIKRNEWMYEVVPLINITRSFVLRFTAFVGHLTAHGDIALDDISLSPECFTSEFHQYTLQTMFSSTAFVRIDFSLARISDMTDNSNRNSDFNCVTSYDFSSCGFSGAKGPRQDICDNYYEENKVQVVQTGKYEGVQMWKVPDSTEYSITAIGARGGLGAQSRVDPNYGFFVHAKLNLTKGEHLYIMVGQPGESACGHFSQQVHPEIQRYCSQITKNISYLADDFKMNGALGGGGGGGGGATVIFKLSPSKQPVILIVAGGGGGLPFSTHERFESTETHSRSGFGGSFNYSAPLKQDGGALLDKAIGGQSCSENSRWKASGGFGGGGGSCASGGGGGGFIGGSGSNVSCSSGGNGTSYVIETASQIIIRSESTRVSGWVQILQPRKCPCKYYCIWDNIQLNKFRCFCPANTTLDADGIRCLGIELLRQSVIPSSSVTRLQIGQWMAIFLPVIILIVLSITILLTYKHKNKKTKSNLVSLDRIMTSHQTGNGMSRQSNISSNHNHTTTAMMQFNPNYDVVIAKCPEQQLNELPRRQLKLSSLLGHGAFGEVYNGILLRGSHTNVEVKVAVKTLPAFCTEQTELDFLMEAVILSKFNHINIVRLIGVCFESHPRYIVLELLEGGDLKTFLRDSRPTASRCPDLTVRDLLRLCLDISCACQHLEEKHFIHRDIAARNCLLTTKGPSRKAKIADFGMARDIYRSDYYKKAGKALLPVKWMPPEAFLDGIFTSKTDIWSYGILLWEIFSLGHMPYPGCSNEEVMQAVTMGGRLTPPQGCPAAVYEIMKYCWSSVAEDRPMFSTLVTSVEKCLQDEDVTSRGLSAFYQPAVPGTHSLRVSNTSSHSTSYIQNITQNENYVGAATNYLEPLIPANSSQNQLKPVDVRDLEECSDDENSCGRLLKNDNEETNYRPLESEFMNSSPFRTTAM